VHGGARVYAVVMSASPVPSAQFTPSAHGSAPFVPIVPAGGPGSRLWPLSRGDRPKFLLDLTGQGRSLLQQTLQRLAPVADRAPIVVTGRAHVDAVRAQAADARILVEPSARNSMPAIALAAAVVERQQPDAVIGSFAADHLIRDTDGFARTVHRARAAAAQGFLVTIGIVPTRPSTAFGYIETEAAGDAGRASADGTAPPDGAAGTDADGGTGAAGAVPVRAFVEKPPYEDAVRFVSDGAHLWNAGMFVVGARVLLDALAEQLPHLASGVRTIARAYGTARYQEVLEEIWPTLTSIAIDRALAEPLSRQGRVAVVPGGFDWDDVGDFAALARQLREGCGGRRSGDAAREPSDVVASGGARTISLGSAATVYSSSARPIALVGVEGISVIETDDVLVVLADEHAQDLSTLVGMLDAHGLGRLR
jgi:mannose-1-phosphate guanylyltransferase